MLWRVGGRGSDAAVCRPMRGKRAPLHLDCFAIARNDGLLTRIYRLYLTKGKTRLLSRPVHLPEAYSALAVCETHWWVAYVKPTGGWRM
jgi:hypothetical protein